MSPDGPVTCLCPRDDPLRPAASCDESDDVPHLSVGSAARWLGGRLRAPAQLSETFGWEPYIRSRPVRGVDRGQRAGLETHVQGIPVLAPHRGGGPPRRAAPAAGDQRARAQDRRWSAAAAGGPRAAGLRPGRTSILAGLVRSCEL